MKPGCLCYDVRYLPDDLGYAEDEPVFITPDSGNLAITKKKLDQGGGCFRNTPKNTTFLIKEISDQGKTGGVCSQGGIFARNSIDRLFITLIGHIRAISRTACI